MIMLRTFRFYTKKVSPAYDLVHSDGMNGEHTTTVSGEDKNPTENDMLKVAEEIGITSAKAKQIIEEVKEAVNESL